MLFNSIKLFQEWITSEEHVCEFVWTRTNLCEFKLHSKNKITYKALIKIIFEYSKFVGQIIVHTNLDWKNQNNKCKYFPKSYHIKTETRLSNLISHYLVTKESKTILFPPKQINFLRVTERGNIDMLTFRNEGGNMFYIFSEQPVNETWFLVHPVGYLPT